MDIPWTSLGRAGLIYREQRGKLTASRTPPWMSRQRSNTPASKALDVSVLDLAVDRGEATGIGPTGGEARAALFVVADLAGLARIADPRAGLSGSAISGSSRRRRSRRTAPAGTSAPCRRRARPGRPAAARRCRLGRGGGRGRVSSLMIRAPAMPLDTCRAVEPCLCGWYQKVPAGWSDGTLYSYSKVTPGLIEISTLSLLPDGEGPTGRGRAGWSR